MALIVAGNFRSKTDAEQVVARVHAEGFPATDVYCIYLNPPGQHDVTPSSERSETSTDAEAPGVGAAAGAAIGGAVGLGIGVASTPIVGPAGAIAGSGVGAYVGSLIGALNRLENNPSVRQAGMLVAVHVPDVSARARVAGLMDQIGARQIEFAEGQWENGKWADFDPEKEPVLVKSEDIG